MNEIGNEQSAGPLSRMAAPNSSVGQLLHGSANTDRPFLLPDPIARKAPIRLAIVDDEQAVLETIRLLFEPEDEFRIVGTFASPKRAIARIPSLHPDVVLMDIRMAEMNGVECAKQLKLTSPALKIVVISAYLCETIIEEAHIVGANYFLAKPFCKSDLTAAIRYTASSPVDEPDGTWVHVLFQRGRVGDDRDVTTSLTPRETSAMRLLAAGKAYKEISFILNISESKAHKVIHNIYRKLGAHSRLEALQRWRSRCTYGGVPKNEGEVGL